MMSSFNFSTSRFFPAAVRCLTRRGLPRQLNTYDTGTTPTNSASQASHALPPARLGGQVMIRVLVDRQPIVRAGQHRPQKLLGVGRLDRVAVRPIRRRE